MPDDRNQRESSRPHRSSGSRHRHRQRVKVRVRSKKKARQSKRPLIKPLLFTLAVAVTLAVIFVVMRTTQSDNSGNTAPAAMEDNLPELPPNRWVEVGLPYTITWTRQRHSGAAYDARRKKYFVFGSDTHGENWDNGIHEFDPLILRWSEHYPPDRRRSYRLNEKGQPVAGDDAAARPWAMHTQANLVFDPQLDALVVTSAPFHNPALRVVRGDKKHPTWIYQLKTREWRALDGLDGVTPFDFGGASAYDSERDIILSYSRKGLWELAPDREHWLEVSSESHHEMHHTLVYDSLHKNFLVFGGQDENCAVWVYNPGLDVGVMGRWEKRDPGGDACAGDRHVPAAFDQHNGVILAVFDDPSPEDGEGEGASSTFVYDPKANTYHKLPEAGLPFVGMNYSLVYDSANRVFYLLQGGRKERPTVWALHLELLTFD